MYNEFFGFKAAPFSIAPDPRYLYMTAQHREALAHLVYGLNSNGGCILLTGEVGTGKTTICRCLLEQIPDQANVALVLNPKVSEIELLETICDELKIDYPESNNSVKTYTDRIYHFLIESNRRNEKTVLIIDEAQNLTSAVLEQLRLLTNLETDQHKLLQIIILGQPELLDILARKEMRQLAQRITARFHLQPLSSSELKAYVSHRLAVAGQNIQLFPENSINLIYRASKGVPRLVNIICDRALLGAYVENQHRVEPSIVRKAVKEVFGELKQVEDKNLQRRILLPALAASMIIAVLVLAYFTIGKEPAQIKASDTDPAALASKAINTSTATGPAKPGTGHTETANSNTVSITSTQTDTGTLVASDTHGSVHGINTTLNNGQGTISSSTVPADMQDTLSQETPDAVIAPGPSAQAEAAVSTSASTSTSPTTDTTLAALFSASDNDNRLETYQQLFKTWGQSYNSDSSMTACNQAALYSLGCLHKLGNINSLRIHNRPAVLKLVDTRGKERYILVTSINNDIASVYFNNARHTISLVDIDRYWYGQFTLFWHKPEHYRNAITPGERGNIIDWLSAQLSLIDSDLTIARSSRYDQDLQDAVIRFQQSQGLVADGIVGPLTIIHLNTATGRALPSLAGPVSTKEQAQAAES